MFTILIILIALYLVSFILSLQNRNLDKLLPYECGLEPIGHARGEFNILFYIIGLLYLIFDLEIIFLFPYAASLWLLNSYFAFIAVIFFFILLSLSFLYEWYSGAFNF